jgi:hypothetical protein
MVLMCGPRLAWSAPPSIDLEVITEPGLSIEAPQKWIAMLKDVGLSNLRVRSGERGDVAEIRKRGTDDRPYYSVTGIATSANILRLPGGNIRLGDKAAMRNWMAKLQDGGEEGVVAKKVMYGLTAKQMVTVHEGLKGVVTFNTKGERTGAVLKKIVDGISLKVVLDPSAAAAAKNSEPVADEFHGLSYGTTMAAVLRPLGFVFVPEKPLGEELQLRVTSAQAVEKPWPVGWDSPTSAGKLAPDYFKTTNAEITDYALGDALAAIQKRIGLPMVFDYNGLARQEVELDAFKVSSKKGKKSYASLVDELLYKARLKAEVRIDEAETPFLWITTSRQ